MTSTKMKMTCRALVASMLVLSLQTVNAGMIGADQAAGQQIDRGAVLTALSRGETAQRLQAQGIDPQMARERIAAMTDQEVRALAADVQAAPAGADGTGTAIAVIIIAAAVWYFAVRK